MPPVLGPVTTADVFRVTLVQRLYGQRLLNTLYYKVTEVAVVPPDKWDVMTTLASEMTAAGNMVDVMADMQTDDLEHIAVRVNRVAIPGSATDPYAQVDIAVPGDLAGAAGTANVAMSFEKRSTFETGKPAQGIGRLQLAGLPQTTYVGGIFDAPTLTLALNLAAEMLEVYTVAGCDLTPHNFGWDYTPPSEIPTGFHVHPLFGVNAKDTVRIMRRRTVGVGE